MARIAVTRAEGLHSVVLTTFEASGEVTIGRNPRSTVALDDPAISWDALRLDLDATFPAGHLANSNGGRIHSAGEVRPIPRGAVATFVLDGLVTIELRGTRIHAVTVETGPPAVPALGTASLDATGMAPPPTRIVESLADHLTLEKHRDDLLLFTAITCDWVVVPPHGDRLASSSSQIPRILAVCAPEWFEGKSPPHLFRHRNMNEIIRRFTVRLAGVEATVHRAFDDIDVAADASIRGYTERAIKASEDRTVGIAYWAAANALPEVVCDRPLARRMQAVRDEVGELRLDALHRAVAR